MATGTSGNDTLTGTAGNDTLEGLAGNDSLDGLAGNDLLLGGEGADTLRPGLGSDTLDGGAMLDRIGNSDANWILYGDLAGIGIAVDLSGISGDGSVGSGSVVKGAGGAGGTDAVANVLEWTLTGQSDSFLGSTAAQFESVNPLAGADTLDGGALQAAAFPNNPNRITFVGAAGAITVDLQAGTVSGAQGSKAIANFNIVLPGSGNDTVFGSASPLIVEVFQGSPGNDSIDGRGGVDQLRFDFTASGVSINLGSGGSDGNGGTDTYRNIEWARGSRFADVISGTAGVNRLEGLAGNDLLRGQSGNDSLIPGTGIDTVDGGAGSDLLILIGALAAYTVTQPDASSLRLVSVALDQDVTVTDIESIAFSDVTRNVASLLTAGNTATGFADSLVGTPGNETINGLGGNDTIEGLAGDDLLIGGSGINSLFGGEGNDTVQNNGPEEHGSLLDGGEGNDLLSGTERAAELFIGGPGNDRIIGGQHRERHSFRDQNTASYADAPGPIHADFSALTGDGNANGGLVTGHGNDTLDAIQRLIGSAFDDTLRGSAQRTLEVFEGGPGNDSIDGGPLLGDGRADNRADYASAPAAIAVDLASGSVSGGAGNDQLANINIVWATSFDDLLLGSDRSPGYEQFIPGAGNDRIEGRGGADLVRYDLTPGNLPVVGSLATGIVADGLGGIDTLVGVEGLAGANLDDILTGSDDPDIVEHFMGGAGNDSIDGRGGLDWVHYDFSTGAVAVTLGGSGAGVGFDGEGGTDMLLGIGAVEGSPFDDQLTGSDSAQLEVFVGGSGADTIDGRGGPDEVSYERGSPEDAGSFGIRLDLNTGFVTSRDLTDQLFNIEHATGTLLREDTFIGNALGNRFAGLGGDDYLEGRDGDDTLLGGAGSDTLDGGRGIDLLDGGDGLDEAALIGTLASYTLSRPAADAVRLVNAATQENVTLRAVETVFFSDTTRTLEQLFAAAGAVAASAFDDTLIGTPGNDTLDGLAGNDSVSGLAGVDLLSGGDGNDTLLGGEGSDQLDGGPGNDLIDGGPFGTRFVARDLNTVSYAVAPGGVSVNLNGISGDGSAGSGMAQDGQGGTDTLRSVQNIIGSAFDDTLVGSSALVAETFDPGPGDDSIDGGMQGDPFGRDRNRVQYANHGAAVSVDLALGQASGNASGNDTLANIDFASGTAFADTLAGSDRVDRVEMFAGGPGSDDIDGRNGEDIARFDTFAAGSGIVVDLLTGTATDGHGGNDTLAGIEGVYGTAFADSLSGRNASFDSLLGGPGNDTLNGRDGHDWVLYHLAASGVVVTLVADGAGGASDGDGGTDVLIGIEAVRGSPFADSITGSDATSVERFEGLAGDDTIDGRGGPDIANYERVWDHGVIVDLQAGVALDDGFGDQDTLLNIERVEGSLIYGDNIAGAAGNEQLLGNGGNDTLRGRGGDDHLEGGDGDDLLEGGSGNDTLSGGPGDDRALLLDAPLAAYTLSAPDELHLLLTRTSSGERTQLIAVEDVVFADGLRTVAQLTAMASGGTAGNDSIDGSGGGDTLDGLAGNDTLRGNAGDDSLLGGEGDDLLVGGDGQDTIDGGQGVDELSFAADSVRVDVDLALDRARAGGVTDLVLGIEHVTGTPLGDDLFGDEADNRLTGLDGNDILAGEDGDDTLIGGDGDDRLWPGTGADSVDGGPGVNDRLFMEGALATTVITAPAAGTLRLINSGSGEDVCVTGVESLSFGGQTLTLAQVTALVVGQGSTTTPTAFDDTLTGTPGNDSIDALAGNDAVSGLGGDDTLAGGDGNDTLTGGPGHYNLFVGGAGNDRIDGGETDVNSFSVDIASWPGNQPLLANLSAGSASQGGFDDTLVGIEAIFASPAADSLRGADGADNERGETLRGGAGNDTLDGGSGVDTAEFTGARAGYSVSRNLASGVITVTDTDLSNGNDGTDQLTNIERLVFGGQMLAFGARAEELARLALVLWSPGIIVSAQLFCRGYSFYDVGYDFETTSIVALQFWTDDDDTELAQRLIANSGSTKTVAQLLATMAAGGGSVEGRAAALREIALDPATNMVVEASGLRANGVVADLFAFGFGQLFDLLPTG